MAEVEPERPEVYSLRAQLLARIGEPQRALEDVDRFLKFSTEPPVQVPNWHEYVGHYFQYPTPWFMDIGRKAGRALFYRLSGIERLARLGSLGYAAQNLVAVARKR